MIAKGQAIGGGAVVLGSGATIGGILGSQDSEYEDDGELVLLAYESNFSNDYIEDTVGRKYGWYLISPSGKISENEQESKRNKKWWVDSYKKWESAIASKKRSFSNEFKSKDEIKSSFSSSKDLKVDASKALNKVCESVYKQKTEKIKFSIGTSDDASKLGNDLLEYCSPLGSIPATVSRSSEEKDYDSGSWGKDKKDKLVSIRDFEAKNNFWPLRNDEFFGKENSDGTGVGLNSTDDKLFHDLYSKKSTRVLEDTVINTCEKAYKSQKTGSNVKVTEGTLLKFCSWS